MVCKILLVKLRPLLCLSLVAIFQLARADTDLGFNLLLSGFGADEVIRQDLAVEGTIPQWLDGIFIQNGGGRFEWPNALRRNLTNAGDGYAKLEVFTFKNGSVQYTSKFARSDWWNKSIEIDDIAPSLTFGKPDPPRRSDRLGLPNVLASNDNLAVNIISIQERLLMVSDQPGSIQFSPDTLEFAPHASPMPPKSAFTDIPPLPHGMMGAFGSAHPLWTGSSLDSSGDCYGLLNVQRLITLDERPEEIRLFKISAAEQQSNSSVNPWLTRRTITTIQMDKGEFAPYMHSFFLIGSADVGSGPSHAVLVQHSMNIAMATLIAGLGLKPISAGFDIDLARPMKFHVIRLSDGAVVNTISVNMKDFTPDASNNSMIVSHTVNGYFAETGFLVLDVIGYDFLFFERFKSDVILNKTERDHGAYASNRAKTFRFTLDTVKGTAVSVFELLPQSDWEFPIINEGFKGKPYCFAYGYEFSHGHNGTGATGLASMAMLKYDMCATNKTSPDGRRPAQVFTRPYHYFVEPWFVPRPGSSVEDDGVVLVLALDGVTNKGVLFVLNAENLAVLATVHLPILINLKTHGRFVWNKQ